MIFKDFQGIINDSLQFKNPLGGKTVWDSINSVFKFTDATTTSFVETLVAHIKGTSSLNASTTLLSVLGRLPEIEGQFSGASAPTPGSATGKFLICSTAGGTYNLHDIVYDTGTVLIAIPSVISRHFTVKSALNGGTVEYISGGLYAREGSGVALRGDGSGTLAGVNRVIRISYSYTNVTVDSSVTIPSGALITRVQNKVMTPFNGTSPSVTVTLNGSTPLTLVDSTVFYPKEAGYGYSNDSDVFEVSSENAGAVRVAITSSGSTAGDGIAYIWYAVPLT